MAPEPELKQSNSPSSDTPLNAPGGGIQPDKGSVPEPAQAQLPAQPPERVFTQAELDRILADRLARQKAQFADYDDLKNKWQKHEDAQKTELQRAQEVAQAAQAERDQALQRAQDMLIRSSFVSEAARAGVAYPEDAYNLADLSTVEIDVDGGSVKGVAEAVTALVGAGRLVMKGKPTPPSLDGGAGGGERPSDKQLPKLTPDELEAARKMGVPPEEYAKYKNTRFMIKS